MPEYALLIIGIILVSGSANRTLGARVDEGARSRSPQIARVPVGGFDSVGINVQPGVMRIAGPLDGVPHEAAPKGIPFDELAVAVPAGNGYVIPVDVPPNWSGPAFAVPPGWNP